MTDSFRSKEENMTYDVLIMDTDNLADAFDIETNKLHPSEWNDSAGCGSYFRPSGAARSDGLLPAA